MYSIKNTTPKQSSNQKDRPQWPIYLRWKNAFVNQRRGNCNSCIYLWINSGAWTCYILSQLFEHTLSLSYGEGGRVVFGSLAIELIVCSVRSVQRWPPSIVGSKASTEGKVFGGIVICWLETAVFWLGYQQRRDYAGLRIRGECSRVSFSHRSPAFLIYCGGISMRSEIVVASRQASRLR